MSKIMLPATYLVTTALVNNPPSCPEKAPRIENAPDIPTKKPTILRNPFKLFSESNNAIKEGISGTAQGLKNERIPCPKAVSTSTCVRDTPI